MSKAEATRLADALTNITFVNGKWQALDEAAALLRQWPDGEPVAWLKEWTRGGGPDDPSEPYNGRRVDLRPGGDGWMPKNLRVTPLYTAPPVAPSPCSLGCVESCKAREHGCASECPALPWQPPAGIIAEQRARIAKLEAALKVAGEALRHGIKTINHLGGAVECMPLHDAIQQIKEAQHG